MRVSIHRIGNSQGVILPKPLLAQLGLVGNELEMTIEKESIVLRKPPKAVRAGWGEAAKRMVEEGEGGLVWPEFGNDGDEDLVW
jgi:antitoxin MazE